MTMHDVLIVGAGPTGLSLAILLGQQGLKVAVIERFQDIYPLPRAVHIDDEVYRILHEMGVGDAFAAMTEPARGMRLLNRNHRLIGEFERKPTTAGGLPQANMFEQPRFERMLRDRLAELSSVDLHVGWRVEHAEETPEGVHIRAVNVDDEGETQTFVGAYVVGCDGANSFIAQQFEVDRESMDFEQRWIVVDIDSSEPCGDWHGVYQVCDTRRARTFMRVVGNRYRWEFALLPDEDLSDYDTIPRLRPMLLPFVEGIPDDALKLVRSSLYTFRGVVARCWRKGRMLIAGDAAHLTPPFIGQGLGAGQRDAWNLAWKLGRVIRGEAPEALLDTYTEERRVHAKALVNKAIKVGSAMTGGGVFALARTFVLPIVRMIPAIGGLVLNSVTPALTGTLVDKGLPRGVRGKLLPLVRLSRDDGEVFIDRLLGAGLGMVAGPKATVDWAEDMGLRVVTLNPALANDRILSDWLASYNADYAVVRPDRTLLTVGHSAKGPATLPVAIGGPSLLQS